MNYIFIWLGIISAVSVIVTAYDKIAAKSGAWRIPEKTLMLLGFLGGAAAMLVTMLIIHHKTRHAKFMVGLPLEIVLHIAIIIAVATLL
ncbi:MAG: DUF1294 domain-containing protein [Clostridia bacterium]|nr:DUF1294 domain-containing protein [Clostridia bacterium]